MADIKNAQEKEVKVEDLLRLKRAERPDEAFWGAFDRELHQRMLQTLVKKDPWYVQLVRGVSGRIAQTTAVGAAAAFLAMMVVRPAFVDWTQPSTGASFAELDESLGQVQDQSQEKLQGQSQDLELISAAPVEVAMSDFDSSLTPDYRMEALTAGIHAGYTQEYAHDTFEVAAYDSGAYVADSASFAGTSLATSLVY
ncbi:hypothetical protein ACWPKO_05090 [Coraliomargarita sp. W4R53]